jgi:hypothetical protein
MITTSDISDDNEGMAAEKIITSDIYDDNERVAAETISHHLIFQYQV